MSYFTERQVFVSTSEEDITKHNLFTGVPQSGVLSPILFSTCLLTFKKYLPRGADILFYIDDICVWTATGSRHVVKLRLQKNFHARSPFLGSKDLRIFPEKIVALAFRRKRMVKYPLLPEGHPRPLSFSISFLKLPFIVNLRVHLKSKESGNRFLRQLKRYDVSQEHTGGVPVGQ